MSTTFLVSREREVQHLFNNSVAALKPLLLRSQPIEGSCSCCNTPVPTPEVEVTVDEDGDEIETSSRLPLWFRTRAGALFCPTCSKRKAKEEGWRLELPPDAKKRAQIEILELVRQHPGIGAIRISSLLHERAMIAYTPRVVLLALGALQEEGLIIRLGAENREASYRYNSQLDFDGQEDAQRLQRRKLDRELAKCRPAAAAANNVVPFERKEKPEEKSSLGRDRLPEIASLVAEGYSRAETIEKTGLSLGQVRNVTAAIARWFGDRFAMKAELRGFLENPRKAFMKGLRNLQGEAKEWVRAIASGRTHLEDGSKYERALFRCFVAWLKLATGCDDLEDMIKALRAALKSPQGVVTPPMWSRRQRRRERGRSRASGDRHGGKRGECPAKTPNWFASKYTLAA